MPNRCVDFQFLAEPTHVNFGGKVHGGMMMKWMDQAGYACAVGWSGAYCVTVSVGAIRFQKPILVGQIVHLNAQVVHTGLSSIHVFVSADATDPKTALQCETNHCMISFVATDETGQIIPAPKWQPQTANDMLLERYAIAMKSLSIQAEEMLNCRDSKLYLNRWPSN